VRLDHHGTPSIIRDVIPAIQDLFNDHNPPKMAVAARLFALNNRFSDEAANLAKLL
jgi:hypothetical protein